MEIADGTEGLEASYIDNGTRILTKGHQACFENFQVSTHFQCTTMNSREHKFKTIFKTQ